VSLIAYFDMYTLQYWHESTAEWRGAGCSSTSREVIERSMRYDAEQCDHSVSFRIRHLPGLNPVPAVLGD